MEIAQVVNKLVGQIVATGDSSRDGERLENLKTMCNLVEALIQEIHFSARDKELRYRTYQRQDIFSVPLFWRYCT